MNSFISGQTAPWLILSVMVAFSGCDSGGTSGSGGASNSTPVTVERGATGNGVEPGTGDTAGTEADSSASGGGWGNLVGRFVYDGTAPSPAAINVTRDEQICGKHNLVDESLLVGDDGGIANVIVYVRTKDVNVHPDLDAAAATEVVIDNKNCRFEPHVLPIWFDRQTLLIRNSDSVGHNTKLDPLGGVGINPSVAAGADFKHTFQRKQSIPVIVSCSIHPWMKAWILPRDNPYVAVTGKDGSFKLEKLPAGELEFQVWHERAGYVVTNGWVRGRFKMTIEPGDNELGTITLDVAMFNK